MFPLSTSDRSPASPGWENRTLTCTSSTATAAFQGTLGMLVETPFLCTIPDVQTTFPSQLAEGKQQFVLSLPSLLNVNIAALAIGGGLGISMEKIKVIL